ncbi:MAG: ABC transporter substrate-binding protein [Xanthobacteraceae bacterium]|jgi:putative tryptophan/tyrosine transport system substrate-binding protein
MKRRAFIFALGSAAALPLAARAQQSAMPVIGYVNSGTAGANVKNIAAFRAGLTEDGFVEGKNVAIEFRWAENQFDRLPALVTGLINRPAAVIVGNTLAALRAKAATATIPIVFTTGSDPVRDGLVTSLARPGGNVTGVVFIAGDLGSKRLELLRQFIPKVRTIAMLVHPNTAETETERKEIQVAAQKMGLSLIILDVTSGGDIEAAFATLAARGADSLLVGTGTFTFNSREQIVSLAARQAIPAMYSAREYTDAGGLMAYGSSISGAYRQASLYAGRILKGEKPANLPVMQSTRFEFVINLKTAKILGLEFHPQLLATADEVIE